MPTYFLSTNFLNSNFSPAQSAAVERKLKEAIPDLIKIAKLEDIAPEVAQQSPAPLYILLAGPADNDAYIERFVGVASAQRERFFFILISEDISASNYKRLVRTGSADWASLAGAAGEIAEIFAKRRGAGAVERSGAADKPASIAFLPSAGGVGNTTLVAEIGVGLKLQKATKERRICVVDLDFQTSHVCDYLDIEPRLKIQEILEDHSRLDAQLFEVFISRHSSGLDVFAAPRSKFDLRALNVAALDALFGLIAKRYELILIDLPVTWFSWTADIVANSSAIIITGINTIPCLRQLAATLAEVREARPDAGKIALAINRCERTLLGGMARRQHVESVLGREQVFYVGNDSAGMVESANTGTPLALGGSSSKTAKEIAEIAAFCAGLAPVRVKSA
jgi:pilus assembly protein CpaE